MCGEGNGGEVFVWRKNYYLSKSIFLVCGDKVDGENRVEELTLEFKIAGKLSVDGGIGYGRKMAHAHAVGYPVFPGDISDDIVREHAVDTHIDLACILCVCGAAVQSLIFSRNCHKDN